MNKVKTKEFWEKNRGKIMIAGGIAVGAALVAVGYKKGYKVARCKINKCIMRLDFDKPIALKDVFNGEELQQVTKYFGLTEDTLIFHKGVLVSKTK